MRKLIVALMLAGLLYCAGALAAVNINSAGAKQLASLSGIGPVKAKAIIDYRKKNGDFESLDDLTQVKGIGDKTLADLRDTATVGDPSDAGDDTSASSPNTGGDTASSSE